MNTRDAGLTAFLGSLFRAIEERARADGDAQRVATTIGRALETERPSSSPEPARLPTCAHLDDAVGNVEADAAPAESSLVDHARALRALSPRLAWWRRPGSDRHGEPFAEGHANATVVGRGGLEERDDVLIGISLMAPGIRYPEHHHPPAEVYLVLSRGQWRQGGEGWHEPGIGGLVYNPPDVLHAMRSGPEPLLAVWCLWNGNREGSAP